ncbi:MAG: purine-nucleoside phosphorylase [Elusimicrobiales bacterium]|jgi:purine-nucleoside phosphorylase
MQQDNPVTNVAKTSAWLKSRIGKFRPVAGIIAGSGLADSLPELADKISIPYAAIPNFPRTTVVGHKGELIFGRLHGKDVVVMRGRFHYYEGRHLNFIAFPVRVLAFLGVKSLIVTAAVGSLRPSLRPGDLLILKDHINFMGANPLMGNYDRLFGEMFPDMNEPYDAALRKDALAAARKLKIPAREGVYIAVTGPSYETPAEVRVYRMFGGSVAGMSVVPEVIAARQLKMKVLGVCWISNFTSGISRTPLAHDDVLALGGKVSVKMKALLDAVMKSDNV